MPSPRPQPSRSVALLTPALLALPAASGAAPDPAADELRRGRARQRAERGAARRCSTATRPPQLDQHGRLLYRDVRPTAAHREPGPSPRRRASRYDQTFLLHSRPGAQRTIYLDFDGQDISGHRVERRRWRSPRGSTRACRSTPSPAVHRRREGRRPGRLAAGLRGLRAVRGRRDHPGPGHRGAHQVRVHGPGLRHAGPGHAPRTGAASGCLGIAYTDVFDLVGGAAYQPAWAFSDEVDNDPIQIAESITHEVGHTLGSVHDGELGGTTTSSATACGARSWAPATARSPSGPRASTPARPRSRTTSP